MRNLHGLGVGQAMWLWRGLSPPVELANMVFQGTVLGPPLWNLYFADVPSAVAKHSFQEAVFADDLNCFRIFDGCHGDAHILHHARLCQAEVHRWGQGNQVVFEQSKESLQILDRTSPAGGSFKILSVVFDGRLHARSCWHVCCGGRVETEELDANPAFLQHAVHDPPLQVPCALILGGCHPCHLPRCPFGAEASGRHPEHVLEQYGGF